MRVRGGRFFGFLGLPFEEDLIAEDDEVYAAAEGLVEEGGVLGFGFHEVFGEGGGGFWVEEGEVCELAFGDGGDGE